ncbi:MAG: alpha/beta hydrolase [Oscillochloridaceae bacterium umkhey_bin13]
MRLQSPSQHFQIRRLMLLLLGLITLTYLGMCGLIYLRQEQMIFFPRQDPPDTSYDFGRPVSEVWLPVAGARLHALWFQVPEPQGVILYLHGNADTLRNWGPEAASLTDFGYDLFIVDYRGYGQSSGTINGEAQLHADMDVVYGWVRERYPADQIVVYGRSLGTGLATRLAAINQPGLLILESPYYSMELLARRQVPWAPLFLLKYPLRSYRWIGQVQSPVVIFHGTADELIPFEDSQRLATYVTAPLTFYALEGGGHGGLQRFTLYHEGLQAALAARHQLTQ